MKGTEKKKRQVNIAGTILGLCAVCNLFVGFLGILFALMAVGEKDYTGVGICLAASALAFGLLANSLLKA
jgi:hypothetical protein